MLIADSRKWISPPFLDIALKMGVACGLIGISAQFSFPIPGSPVPITLQTLMVLGVGICFGGVRAGIVIALYLLAGIIGFPIFSGGKSGWEAFSGSSLGFFIGFFLSAIWVGFIVEKHHVSRLIVFIGLFAAGHVLILWTGFVGLAWPKGPAGLWTKVFLPLLPGGVAKTLLGAILAFWGTRFTRQG